MESLSARRAWIEIDLPVEESEEPESLSARRAWIEILNVIDEMQDKFVALRKESVDRNISLSLIHI